jgi:hypothetical protein
MGLIRVTGDAKDRGAGGRVPIRRAEPGEGRHEVNTFVAIQTPGQRLRKASIIDNSQTVPQPLDR